MKLNRRKLGRKPMELIEEAVHLLRMTGTASLAAYYIGTLPFVLALLYFWGDMSRSPFANTELPGAALGLALLFLWMKFWQAVFLNNLRSRISAQQQPRWTFGRCLRIFVIQTAIQPSAVLMLPLAMLALLVPFGWAYAFYQNVTALTDGGPGEMSKVFKRAWKQSTLWPVQNYAVLVLLLAFAFFVFLNLMSICFLLPELLKTLLGIDSMYSQSPLSMFNTTVITAVLGLTYLCVDPIAKTVYLLRCFYGEALQSGEDLKAELKQLAPLATQAAAVVLTFILVCSPCRAADGRSAAAPDAKAPPAKVEPTAVPAPTLDKTINDVLHQPKYTWRMPREKVIPADTKEGPVMRFFDSVLTWIKHTLKKAWDWLDEWLRKLFPRRTMSGSPNNVNWMGVAQSLLVVLVVVVVCVLAIVLLRVWQKRSPNPQTVSTEAIGPVPDLKDENVGADQLPEDGWINLGRELLGRGEFRVALRAFYFASLSHLASRSLISIAKFKSNRDYERELWRRGHSLPDLLSLFGENVSVFDRVWYGLHDVNQEVVGNFLVNVEKIKAAA